MAKTWERNRARNMVAEALGATETPEREERMAEFLDEARALMVRHAKKHEVEGKTTKWEALTLTLFTDGSGRVTCGACGELVDLTDVEEWANDARREGRAYGTWEENIKRLRAKEREAK